MCIFHAAMQTIPGGLKSPDGLATLWATFPVPPAAATDPRRERYEQGLGLQQDFTPRRLKNTATVSETPNINEM